MSEPQRQFTLHLRPQDGQYSNFFEYGGLATPMSDPIRVTLDVTADCDAVLEPYCAKYLRSRGYNVVKPGKHRRERLCQFLKRIKLRNYDSFHLSLAQWLRDGNTVELFYAERPDGTDGRLNGLTSNPAFDAFCLRHKVVQKRVPPDEARHEELAATFG